MTNGTKPGRWSLRLLAMVLLLGLFPAINLLVDPFGVFGDPLFHWYGYNETNNPRVAKVAWLEEHKEEFDSYIIGSSCAASYNVKELDRYLDASFYNFFVYGSDARDYRAHATYLLENCQVKNLVLSLNFNEANTEEIGRAHV